MLAGILGGTFDPPHRGHLSLALAAMRAAGLERVMLIPASRPPHKHRSDISPARHRLAMTCLLACEHPGLVAEPAEVERPGPSYTIDTARALLARDPGLRLRLILGADMVQDFGFWKSAEELLVLAPPLVAERPGSQLAQDLASSRPPGLSGASCQALQQGRFPMQPCGISSSRIREAFAAGAGADASSWLTPGVLAYIHAHGLYTADER